MDVSIIVCTRDRCEDLLRLCESLDAMVVPERLRWEVVIMDNGSSDKTPEVCRSIASRNPKRYQCISEPRKGKSVALNRGIEMSNGEILAFTDDDCIVDLHWLEEIVAEFSANPRLGVLGGRVELYDQRDQPLTTVCCKERVEQFSIETTLVSPLFFGCNMAVRRSVIATIGEYDILMGPGTPAVAEDTDLLYRAYRNGVKIAYSPSMLVFHNHGRRSEAEIQKTLYHYHIGRGALYWKHAWSDFQVAKAACRDIGSALKHILLLKGIKWSLRFIKALLKGAMTRANLRGRRDLNRA